MAIGRRLKPQLSQQLSGDCGTGRDAGLIFRLLLKELAVRQHRADLAGIARLAVEKTLALELAELDRKSVV